MGFCVADAVVGKCGLQHGTTGQVQFDVYKRRMQFVGSAKGFVLTPNKIDITH